MSSEKLSEALEASPTTVLVASPTDQHIAIALEAVKRGCHVFVEKPVSHSLQHIGQLCAEIDLGGLVSMVACNMRFHPGPAVVKRLIEERAVRRSE